MGAAAGRATNNAQVVAELIILCNCTCLVRSSSRYTWSGAELMHCIWYSNENNIFAKLFGTYLNLKFQSVGEFFL